MKKSELQQMIKEEIQNLNEASKPDYEKDKKTVINHLMTAYKITTQMEGSSISGQTINELLMQVIDDIQKVKFKSWDEFDPKVK